MSGKQIFSDIFLYVIGSVQSDYASFVAVYQRPQSADRKTALAEIQQGLIENHWSKVSTPSNVVGIDMAFSGKKNCLVFVLIAGELDDKPEETDAKAKSPNHGAVTYFGSKIVRELALNGKPRNNIVMSRRRHKIPGQHHPILCSFEVNIVGMTNELSQSAGASTMSRFPIVFDFVDSNDGRSPVFKRPSGGNPLRSASTNFALTKRVLSRLGHGGIHPRGGSSLIELS